MADEETNTDNQVEESNEDSNPNLARLREKAARADELEAKLRDIERRDTFAGLNIETGPGKMLADMYKPADGEPFSREGLEKLAEQYGLKLDDLSSTAGNDEQESQDTSMNQNNASPFASTDGEHFDTMSTATGAGGTETSGNDLATGDPGRAAWTSFDQELKQGLPRDVAQRAAVGTILQAAAQGNPDALYDQERWRASKGA